MKSLAGLRVVDGSATPAAGTLLVSGRITNVDRGSRLKRMLIGFGAGRARLHGAFEIDDERGDKLVQFEAGKDYSGGVGMGGVDFVDIEDLMEQFGAETAVAVWHWSRGEEME